MNCNNTSVFQDLLLCSFHNTQIISLFGFYYLSCVDRSKTTFTISENTVAFSI